jgi:transcriptional regulator with XRE-family HTH domain
MKLHYDPQAVKRIRKARGLDVETLAKRARLSPNSIYLYERGTEPKAGTLARLAVALGEPVSSFFAGVES